MTINNLQQPVPVGSAMGPRNGSGPNKALHQQLQNRQMEQNRLNQQITNQVEIQKQQQNQQRIAQQVAMATGAGMNINFTA